MEFAKNKEARLPSPCEFDQIIEAKYKNGLSGTFDDTLRRDFPANHYWTPDLSPSRVDYFPDFPIITNGHSVRPYDRNEMATVRLVRTKAPG